MSAITDEVVEQIARQLLKNDSLDPDKWFLPFDRSEPGVMWKVKSRQLQIRAVLKAAVACGVVPNEDQVIVPKKPTEAMIHCMDGCSFSGGRGKSIEQDEWRILGPCVFVEAWPRLLKAAAPKAEGE